MRDGVERARKQPAGKRVFQQELRHVQQFRMVVEPGAKLLQAAQVIGQAQLLAPICAKIVQ